MDTGRRGQSPLWWPLLFLLSLSSQLLSQAPLYDEEEMPALPPSPGDPRGACPAQCDCPTSEAVECGGVDLTAFPSNLSNSIQHLSLQNNRLEEIPYDELSRLTELKTLNLHNNRLSSAGLPDEALLSLGNLQYIYLASNRLTVAPRILPRALRIVDMAANTLEEIFPLTFGEKPHLKSVYLHDNKLQNSGLPDSLFNGSDSVSTLILSNNLLSVAPRYLPLGLNRLHLQNNQISWIPKETFSQQLQLRELYLQNNRLTDPGLEPSTFSKLRSLEYLDLSMNNLTHIPEGLPANIVILHLGKNRISSVSEAGVSGIRNLEYLLLQNNVLTADSIHHEAFSKLRKLHTLHIYNNHLEHVPSSLPRRVRSLMMLNNRISELRFNDLVTTYYLNELNLSYNRLRSSGIHRLAFRKLRRLEQLDLSGNFLTVVPQGLPSGLKVLRLHGNRIDKLAEEALSGLGSLTELHLGENRLHGAGITPASWKEVPVLQLLDLSGNQLTQVPPNLPESLEYLHIQDNLISSIPAEAFASTPNLRGLFMRSNKLVTLGISDKAFRNLKHLQVVDMTGNPEAISIHLPVLEDTATEPTGEATDSFTHEDASRLETNETI
ncbi:podocan-like [Polypterus senegalus]|uniref:podocan-like n=1 Tax=Polypterus senegalus TaxID=55291 RepID=UPI001962E2A1|nr:podocan-like [Polypterus senegalus]